MTESTTVVPRPPKGQKQILEEAPGTEWKPRARAYEAGLYPWRFRDLPTRVNGKPNPQLDSAVFVVHGMGSQLRLDTAVGLRDGFEETLDWIQGRHGGHRVAPPFTYEGYWADYESLEETFPEHWATFEPREREFFSRLWKRRTASPERTLAWFVREGLRLIRPRMIRKVGLWRWLAALWFTALALVVLPLTYVRHRRVLGEVLADVRIYAEPRGDVERVIVQRIDHRVGAQFLRLLGVDWDFRDLPKGAWVKISGEPHRFEHVTWVAHSLGTVVSYNVISDLLARAREVEGEIRRRGGGSEEDRKRLANVERVREGFHRFITLGSPLQKFSVLYPQALRTWNKKDAEQVAKRRGWWWTNFYHVWDPVSGRLVDEERFHGLPRNRHTVLWRLPGLAHVTYWRDRPVTAYVLSRAYGKETLEIGELNYITEGWARVARRATYVLVSAGTVATVWTREAWWPTASKVAGALLKTWLGG